MIKNCILKFNILSFDYNIICYQNNNMLIQKERNNLTQLQSKYKL